MTWYGNITKKIHVIGNGVNFFVCWLSNVETNKKIFTPNDKDTNHLPQDWLKQNDHTAMEKSGTL
jgi:hypothetical protein